MKSYHIGLLKAGNKLIVECRRNIDYLSCELWRYLGERETTKARLKKEKQGLLGAVNAQYGTNFKYIQID